MNIQRSVHKSLMMLYYTERAVNAISVRINFNQHLKSLQLSNIQKLTSYVILKNYLIHVR